MLLLCGEDDEDDNKIVNRLRSELLLYKLNEARLCADITAPTLCFKFNGNAP